MAETDGAKGNLRLAVLIDADNAPRDSIKGLIDELAIYGVPTIKRIYGDWTSPNIKGWKDSLLENAFTPVQQYSYTTGKNSTDSAMIIDAMDILYAGRTDGFVLVSSDSDFTRLATRLREAGMYVIGIGERKTPGPFIVSCDKFIYIEVIRERFGKAEGVKEPPNAQKPAPERKKTVQNKKPAASVSAKPAEKPDENHAPKSRVPEDMIKMIADSVADLADDAGYAALSDLTNLINKKRPDFDPRNFGFGKLSNMMKYLSRFEVDVRETGDPHAKPMYIRDLEA